MVAACQQQHQESTVSEVEESVSQQSVAANLQCGRMAGFKMLSRRRFAAVATLRLSICCCSHPLS